MSAERRARLARAARAVLGAESDVGVARAAALRRTSPRPVASITDLEMTPAWLPDALGSRTRFINTAGTAAVAPELARVIDGAMLRTMADQVGSELVDWALKIGVEVEPAATGLDQDANLAELGAEVVRTGLPASLAPYFSGSSSVSADRASWALAQARACAS